MTMKPELLRQNAVIFDIGQILASIKKEPWISSEDEKPGSKCIVDGFSSAGLIRCRYSPTKKCWLDQTGKKVQVFMWRR